MEQALNSFKKPIRPSRHFAIPVPQWRHNTVYQIFGATNTEHMDGICGALFVEVQTGNVAEFFHLANGDYTECAILDDLVVEGWGV